VTPDELVRYATQSGLSEREWEILTLTIQNLARKEMARRLGISINTVKRDCDRLHKNLGMEDKVEIVRSVAAFVIQRLRDAQR
jgi:DNA-binding CsgD family transcriptional regulator